MGGFSSMFMRQVRRVLLACTHAYPSKGISDAWLVPRAACRVEHMVMMFAATLRMIWDPDMHVLRLLPRGQGADARAPRPDECYTLASTVDAAGSQEYIKTQACSALDVAGRYLSMSDMWACHAVINQELAKAYVCMYATIRAAYTREHAGQNDLAVMGPQAYDVVLELARTAARLVCEAFLRHTAPVFATYAELTKPPAGKDVAALFRLAPEDIATLKKGDEERLARLTSVIPHLHKQLRLMSTRRFAKQVILAIEREVGRVQMARVCATVKKVGSFTTSNENEIVGQITVGGAQCLVPDPEVAMASLENVLAPALTDAYNAGSDMYASGAKSARLIARAIIQAVQGALDGAECGSGSSQVTAAAQTKATADAGVDVTR